MNFSDAIFLQRQHSSSFFNVGVALRFWLCTELWELVRTRFELILSLFTPLSPSPLLNSEKLPPSPELFNRSCFLLFRLRTLDFSVVKKAKNILVKV